MTSAGQVKPSNVTLATQRVVTTPPGHSITLKNETKERALVFEHLLLQLYDFQNVIDDRHVKASPACGHGSAGIEPQER